MSFYPRKFQLEAVNAFFENYRKNPLSNPVISMYTGAGKSFVIAMIMCHLVKSSDTKFMVVTHSAEVLKQDIKAFIHLLEEFNIFCTIGIYSSKLKKKELDNRVTFCTVGSVYKNIDKFDIDYLIVDEAHLVGDDKDSMYRRMISGFDVPVLGLSGSPFRMRKGYLHEMEGGVFTDLVYDTNTPEIFAEMIALGYLAKPIREKLTITMDVTGVKKTAGDFNLKDLSLKFDRDGMTEQIVTDLLRHKEDKKHWFIFAIDKKHAESISEELNKQGIVSDFVHSTKEEDTDIAITKFRNGEIQALVSVLMLTTGVDIPIIDMLVMMRPTASVVIHLQTIGRGLRTTPTKNECLILDYAGNIVRNGAIDDPIVHVAGKGKAGGKMEKECPDCGLPHHISIKKCQCGHEFKFKTNLETTSSQASLMKEVRIEWYPVRKVEFSIHKKIGKPDSIKARYYCGLRFFDQFLCVYHGGFVQRNSRYVISRMNNDNHINYELSVDLVLKQIDTLNKPTNILVDTTNKYSEIKDMNFD
ncbi:MAG: DEAD/DEAH box helicase [Candidatus Scalindua sp.]|jgi:DNA repair protein RadD|nr:DEAD/DEAH box helicase [Candidatus Scalindua sp.]